MLRPISSKAFEKDIHRCLKRWFDVSRLRSVMDLLIGESPLDPKFRNHKLVGNWKGRQECHVAPDWILIYRLSESEVLFERTGTHSDLLE